MSPTCLANDSADLLLCHSELRCKADTATPSLDSMDATNFSHLAGCEFGSYRLFAILHRVMSAHHELVISMCRPAEIFQAVIPWLPIQMSHIGKKVVDWLAQEGYRYQPVSQLAEWSADHPGRPQSENDISVRGNRPCQHVRKWMCPPPSPHSRGLWSFLEWPSPASYLADVADFIVRKSRNVAPFCVVHVGDVTLWASHDATKRR